MAYTNNTLTLSENTFQDNSADYGGALEAYANNTLTLSENTFQNNSADYDGGALYANTLTLSENTFQDNSADNAGGALSAYTNNIFTLSEHTFQENSTNENGGALHAYTNNTLTLSENTFQKNYAKYGGALFAGINNTLTLSVNTFQDNSANYVGGGLCVISNNTLILSENTFQCNSAGYGGALMLRQSTVNLTNNTVTGNTAESKGGAIFCLNNCTLQVYGSHILQNNTAQRGGAVAALGCQILLAGDMILENNTAFYGGGLYTEQSEVRGYAYFSRNIAHRSGGGIYASSSDLYSKQCILFVGNSAMNGGGLLLADDSKFYLCPNTAINFTNNFVQKKGGAMKVVSNNPLGHCVEESCKFSFIIGSDCFFQIQTEIWYNFTTNVTSITELHNVRMHFHNNTALEAGAMLYGGSVDGCSLSLINTKLVDFFELYRCPNSGEVFDYITSFDKQSQDISSDPLYICSCECGEPDCSASSITRSVYPGGTIEVAIIAYGQRNGPTLHMITPRDDVTTKELRISQKGVLLSITLCRHV